MSFEPFESDEDVCLSEISDSKLNTFLIILNSHSELNKFCNLTILVWGSVCIVHRNWKGNVSSWEIVFLYKGLVDTQTSTFTVYQSHSLNLRGSQEESQEDRNLELVLRMSLNELLLVLKRMYSLYSLVVRESKYIH